MIKGDTHSRNSESPDSRDTLNKIGIYFLLAYLSQGISCAQFGVIAQPIQFFMMRGLGFDAAQISANMSLLMLPWMLKPFYGLLSDFVPLFGYRRKSYLIFANAFAALAFLVMFCANSLSLILVCLMLTALSMAVATVLMVGLAVEEGRAGTNARTLFIIQEIAYYSANIAAVIFGGILCQNLTPLGALHIAALLAVAPLLLISFLTFKLVFEERSFLNRAAMGDTMRSLKDGLRSPALWLVVIFSFLWSFLPSFGVPLYFYESKTLGFSQSAIGQLAAWNSAGMLLASFAYPLLLRFLSLKGQLIATTVLVIVSTISFRMISTPASASFLEFFHGFANLTAILSLYGFAADVCPRRIEVSVMAWLVAVRNIATSSATFVGGQLFQNVVHEDYKSLVVLASLAPSISLMLIPLACKFRASVLAAHDESGAS